MNKKKVILITGASADIGLKLVEHYSDFDVEIIAHANRNIGRIQTLKEKKTRATIHAVKADLSVENEVLGLCDFIAKVGVLDTFIHLPAPELVLRRHKDTKWEHFQHHLNVQLKSAHLVLASQLPQMAKARCGNVVFVLSSVVLNSPPNSMSDYVVTKYALLGYMKCMVKEYAAKSIRFNAISPSMFDSKYIDQIPDFAKDLSREAHPLKRLATKDEVFSVLKFLVSDDSSFLNGVNIPVTGGEIF